MCLVVSRDEVHNGDIALLAVAVAASDPLFDTLRIPWQVVIDNRFAELQIQPFGTGLCRDEDFGAGSKLMNQRQTDSNLTTRPESRPEAAAFLFLPTSIGFLRSGVIVHSPEESDLVVSEADFQ